MNSQRLSKSLKHKTIFTILTATSLFFLENAQAFTVYKTDKDLFTIFGRIAGNYNWNINGSSDNKFDNGGSRVSLYYQHSFDNGWHAFARGEWGFDPFFVHGTDNHNKRLMFFGASHSDYGTMTFGKQNSIMYTLVDSFTDQPWLYTDYTSQTWMAYAPSLQGMVRPDRTFSYINVFDKLTVGFMYGTAYGDINQDIDFNDDGSIAARGGRGLKRNYLAQLAFNYRVGYDVTLIGGYSYTRLERKNFNATEQQKFNPNMQSWEVGFNWAPNNWYISALGGEGRNVKNFVGRENLDSTNNSWQKLRNYDVFASYTFKNVLPYELGNLQLYGEYSYAKDLHQDNKIQRTMIGIAAVTLKEKLIIALEHMWMNDKNTTGQKLYDHDVTGIVVRYNY